MAEFKKRYRNSKGQFIATRVVENVRAFYSKNFSKEDRRKINIYNEIKAMDKNTLEQTSSSGAGLFVTDPIMYVGYSETPTTQIDFVQKLSVAKKMNTILLYKGEQVSQSKLKDIIRESIKESEEKHLLENNNYYRTYIFLTDDIINNTLTFDPESFPNKSH